MSPFLTDRRLGWTILMLGVLLTFAIYMQGIGGGFLFDDYPNIVDNTGVQPKDTSMVTLVKAALSSPASEFKRPLASLSFAANYLLTGGDAEPMKMTNIVIHLLNGIACFFLSRLLVSAVAPSSGVLRWRPGTLAALLATGWMLLPINLTSVLYVVQRMESLANLAVFLALIGYIKGRQRMRLRRWAGLIVVIGSITIVPLIGVLAKETAILAPLYALCIELLVFRGQTRDEHDVLHRDRRITHLYIVLLAVPFVIGGAWLWIKLSNPRSWASRDFTLYTRLLSECRIVLDYIAWTVAPTAESLSFYHDGFVISTGWLEPISTVFSAAALFAIAAIGIYVRRKLPLLALGIALFLACQSLTSTVIPLELIYEHRNYFASYGVMLALVPMLAAPRLDAGTMGHGRDHPVVPRRVLLVLLLTYWAGQTWMTANAWGTPLGLARELAARNPDSPRAQYELGRMYIILSRYNPSSPFTKLAYTPLERAMVLPKSSILPEQALIFLNARMRLPLSDNWWDSMVRKLAVRRPSIQDESALGALGTCAIQEFCQLPPNRMIEAYGVALSHPNPTGRLQAMYADYAWSMLHDETLALRLIQGAVSASPNEPTYRISWIRLLLASGHVDEASAQLPRLDTMNYGGALASDIDQLRNQLAAARK